MKKHNAMLAAIKRGDKIITGGGIVATVVRTVNEKELLIDLGEDPGYRSARQENYDRLFTWFRGLKVRTEMPIEALFDMGPELDEELGIMIGHW